MSNRPNVLVIAPYAPPKNAAEAIQVRRMLAELDKHARGRVITLPPDKKGWAQADASLDLKLQHFDVQHLKLPFHSLTNKVMTSHLLAHTHQPDELRWIIWMAGRILDNLPEKPDIIYSRSFPVSAALLARELKAELGVPWIMHLSDPWADSPYANHSATSHQQEADTFADADLISVTTDIQAQHYRKKYPTHAAKIFVSPNMMPEPETVQRSTSDRLHIVFAGNFYGARSPEPLIHALATLDSQERSNIRVDIYGNADPSSQALLTSMPDVLRYHGAVAFDEAWRAQRAADVILSIEPALDHPLGNAFMPSKVLEAIALGKPLLAVTPAGSETAAICGEGYGWAVSNTNALATKLKELIATLSQVRAAESKAPPVRFAARHVAADLFARIQQLGVK